MSYASLGYLGVFLTLSFAVYYLVPLRRRWLVLLVGSCLFSVLNSGWLFCSLLATAAVSWRAGIRLNGIDDALTAACENAASEEKAALRETAQKKKHRVVALALIIAFGLLVFFKYYNFLGQSIDKLLALAGAPEIFPFLGNLKLPLGISFYTLMAASYVLDVYRGKYRASESFPKVLLFLSFFPEIVEGPIGRFDRLSDQLTEGHAYDSHRCALAVQLILWGILKKLVIADRANGIVSEIFTNHAQYSGLTVVFAAALYTLQIYADFSGMIDVSRGSAELFGVTLDQNFQRPFFSHTVGEFWRRWHITLGTWLKEYIFFPASLSKRSISLRRWAQQHLKPYYANLLPLSRALLFVWAMNGIWHGSGWKYLAYGLYYFAITIIGLSFEPLNARICKGLHIDRASRGYHAFQLVRTLVLVCVGMMLFRADTLTDFSAMFASIFSGAGLEPFMSGAIFTHGFDRHDLLLTAVNVVMLIVIGVLQERGHALRNELSQKSLPVRWSVYFAMILIVIIFGAYGTGYQALDPIYGGF